VFTRLTAYTTRQARTGFRERPVPAGRWRGHPSNRFDKLPSVVYDSFLMSQAQRTLALLQEWVQSESLRKHCCAVADSMKHFASLTGADADSWEAVGLLHDMDYERHPNQEQSPTEGHPFVGVAWLREHGWSEEVCRAILSHADYAGVPRTTPLEKTLYAVDELSGFVMAVARVRPSKSIREVDAAAVKKKMKDKAFARAVNRDDITRGAAELGTPLEEVITEVIKALTADADRLGLAGAVP
jgi:putative nucleotidyltransferase with HDIG domain